MRRTGRIPELDDLRLIALGRIPRCAGCPRFQALREARRTLSPRSGIPLPAAPAFCTHRVCAPLADRCERPNRLSVGESPLLRLVPGGS